MPPVVTHTPFLLLLPSPLPPCASPHRTTYYMHPTDALSATAGVIGMVDFTLDDPRVISIAEAAEHPEDLGPPRVFFKSAPPRAPRPRNSSAHGTRPPLCAAPPHKQTPPHQLSFLFFAGTTRGTRRTTRAPPPSFPLPY